MATFVSPNAGSGGGGGTLTGTTLESGNVYYNANDGSGTITTQHDGYVIIDTTISNTNGSPTSISISVNNVTVYNYSVPQTVAGYNPNCSYIILGYLKAGTEIKGTMHAAQTQGSTYYRIISYRILEYK